MAKKWYTMSYETREWKNKENLLYLSRQNKSKILPTYESSTPDTIADNVTAMHTALNTTSPISMATISEIHKVQ